MTDKDFRELKELILGLDKKVDVGFAKVDVGFAEVKGEFKRIDVELKRIEEKLDNKLDGYEKRLASAEFISRASVTAIFIGFAGLVGGLAKLIFFSN